MLRINLLEPKAEPMAVEGRFILPLWRESNFKTNFLVLELIKGRGLLYYNLKKVVKSMEYN